MTISSRTPEGQPNHCPVCRNQVVIEPSQPAGDAPCPNCGTLLWFICNDAEVRLYDAARIAPIREQLIAQLAKLRGLEPARIPDSALLTDLGADSLDQVELVMELEEHFDLDISDDESAQMKTVADVIDWLERRLED